MTLISAVEALGEIVEQLGKKGWNFNLKHYDKNLNWQTPIVDSSLMYDCTVNCTCLSDDECHISAMSEISWRDAKYGQRIQELTFF
ncbi:hypothetical protein CsSME_00049990 [Camellia sinensis var. sinensis]